MDQCWLQNSTSNWPVMGKTCQEQEYNNNRSWMRAKIINTYLCLHQTLNNRTLFLLFFMTFAKYSVGLHVSRFIADYLNFLIAMEIMLGIKRKLHFWSLKCIFGQKIFSDIWKRCISVIYCTNTQRKGLHINSEIVNLKFLKYYWNQWVWQKTTAQLLFSGYLIFVGSLISWWFLRTKENL